MQKRRVMDVDVWMWLCIFVSPGHIMWSRQFNWSGGIEAIHWLHMVRYWIVTTGVGVGIAWSQNWVVSLLRKKWRNLCACVLIIQRETRADHYMYFACPGRCCLVTVRAQKKEQGTLLLSVLANWRSLIHFVFFLNLRYVSRPWRQNTAKVKPVHSKPNSSIVNLACPLVCVAGSFSWLTARGMERERDKFSLSPRSPTPQQRSEDRPEAKDRTSTSRKTWKTKKKKKKKSKNKDKRKI